MTVSRYTKDDEAFMAVLREKDGKRILPVLMNRNDALLLTFKLKGGNGLALPSTMADIMQTAFVQCGMSIEEVRIAAVEAGVTYCHILYRARGTYHMIRFCKAADCLILACTFGCPITISTVLLEQQYMREVGDGMYSMPVNSVSVEALKEALKRAVEDENYELASQLRDEIKRRK